MTRRRFLLLTGGAAVTIAVLAVVTAVVTGSRGASSAPAPGAFAAIHSGPQGMVGQFVVKCGYSHTAMDDPIVHPAMAGMSHSHDFFGSRSTNAQSTAASLTDGPTTCNQRRDTAAYWAPTLYDHGTPVVPLGAVAYYRPAPGVDPTSLQPFPAGLMMIAGNSMAEDAQPVEVAAWTCGSSSNLQSEPPDCPPDAPLRSHLTFADCWDGTNLDSADHRSHVAPSHNGHCPKDHPVALPQLTLTVRYPVSGSGHDLTLASGPTTTVHADFLNSWDQAELTNQVDLCLHRNLVCSVASNRAEDEPT
ncbi:MAG TPA: DUF1996 domain-containing protein [Acidimicrobiales bacterium]